ncbi:MULTISPECIES: VENN motif pre-toxin domain-containing protein, partial [unclassified Gilliamella]|uniref:VENN motif pre-toxin domain-containing protein n=1 Tax=unclassified Gilliamella TaxID=2685620 RepID=UPI001322584E
GGKDIKDLTEAEKQNISALTQLVMGLSTAVSGGDAGDISTSIAASKNAVENNYLNSQDHQKKVGLEYREEEGLLTDEEKQQLMELRIKDESTSEALLEACVDVNSEACRSERKKAYEALGTYINYYYNKLEEQNGYQQIKHLLDGTSNSPEANQLRAIYEGYVQSYKSFGYNDEEARQMAGRTIGAMMIVNGITGTITLPKINKILGSGKLLSGKGTNANKPLDKDYFESEYGKGNVEQGGGNYKETKDKILDNQVTNQKGNESSKFGDHVKNENQLTENWNNTNQAHNVANSSKLKDNLTNENLNNIAKQDPRLSAVVKGGNGELNYGVGTGTSAEADKLGMIWVGDGAKQMSNGGWISADGTRGYRPPSSKPNSPYAETGVQANFETYKFGVDGKRIKVGNGHLNIKD